MMPAALPIFDPPYAEADEAVVPRLMRETRIAPEAAARVAARARTLIEGIRKRPAGLGGVEDFLKAYSLSTREGLAVMVLAEALLRVPDAATADKLIEDKLSGADFGGIRREGDTFLVAASAWALAMTTRLIHPGETPEGVLAGLVKRLGMPAVRKATRQAVRVMGHQFVLGETIGAALKRARDMEKKGYRHSYDMLGEGARTAADAAGYFESYAAAIAAIGKGAGTGELPARPGISVKLSALHPRYEAVQRERVMAELVPRVIELARAAKADDLNMTVDAEEADRLALSLEVIAKVAADPSLAGWDGFGLAVQAYQKRATAVVDYMGDLAHALDRRFMVRLVKGAYWDTEVKRAQERGLADYPVFTRKPATDLSYLAAARRLLALRPRLYPQFATHNALTVADIIEAAGDDRAFEFQRLHGMGEALYRQVTEEGGQPCRIYAPVGGHSDLLAYLVRRLLENGANSSFVASVGDPAVTIDTLVVRPEAKLDGGQRARHARIPLPARIFGERENSRGIELADDKARAALVAGMARVKGPVSAVPLIGGKPETGAARSVVSPFDPALVVGSVVEADAAAVGKAVTFAHASFTAWRYWSADARAVVLERAADLLEKNRDRLMALLALEAGKTLPDGIAEIREAVDFCRFYAAEARRLFGAEEPLPGPTGEGNRLGHRGRGVFACISPWNFPLAIFMGQVTAALAAGNTVVAKPAEQTPLVAAEAVRLLLEAGVPGGALQLVTGDGKVGAALTADPRIAGVCFTGSTETAWAINRTLAEKRGPIVPLIAETGGINAMIVDATALPEQVADDVVTSAFRSAGQRCSALRILYLQDDVADRITEMVKGAAAELKVGDPRDPATDVGPLIDAEAKEKIVAHVDRMRAAGKVVFEGKAPAAGYFVAPTIVALDDPAELQEEVFGPVLHIVRWRADELGRVLATIEATGYGLTLGIHSRIEATIRRIVDVLPVGNVYINRNVIGAVVGAQPFGGSGLSGTGPKAGGPAYLSRFAQEQVVSVNTAAAGGNASLVALGDE
jgi:RHH-type proline utilization regulon transcriptional repressor/proline dehydrogenase/delta 1-pyrroline-5-carboxylate dehydrogenase